MRSRRYKITHDAEIALTGATNGDPGILVIGGTGSIAFGRNAAGRTARAGGWGYIFGDEGGGFDLTRRALRAALRDEEGWGPATQLRSMLLAATGAPDMNDLLHRFYTPAFPRPQIASFSRLVSSAAAVGDEIARQILRDAASALALYAGGVYHQLFSADEEFQVAYVGGVFTSDLLRNEFDRLIQEQMEAIPGPPQFGPAAGARFEARRGDGNESRLSHVSEFER